MAAPTALRRCSRCGLDKPREWFRGGYCRGCRADLSRERYHSDARVRRRLVDRFHVLRPQLATYHFAPDDWADLIDLKAGLVREVGR